MGVFQNFDLKIYRELLYSVSYQIEIWLSDCKHKIGHITPYRDDDMSYFGQNDLPLE